MPTLFNRFLNNVGRDYANDGFPIAQMDGDGGGIVNIAVVNITSSGLPPSDGTITLELFPFGTAQVGTDSLGNIGVTKTWTRTPPPNNFYVPTGGVGAEFLNGFFGQTIRGVVNLPQADVPDGVSFSIQLSCLTSSDMTPDPGVPQIDTIDNSDVQFDEETEEGQVTISWEIDDPTNIVDYFLIEYSFDGVTFFPWASVPGDTRQYTDYVYLPDTTTYRVIPVNIDTETIPDTDPPTTTVVFTGAPDVSLTTSLQVDLGFQVTAVFSGDPSGLYTLVSGKHEDTLYQRSGSEDTEDVAIPRPFFRTAYVP